jgi:nondiscriminating glutamyl-tRNA synthetase
LKTPRIRFAPSPTGFIHVGNARTALFNWLYARQQGGAFILRIEDTDVERSSPEYEERLIADLRWLGLDWDEGPDVGGEFGPYRQSERLEIYRTHTQKLLEEEKAYYCFCPPEGLEKDRAEALAAGRMPIYSGRCRRVPTEDARRRVAGGEKGAVRLKVPDEGTLGYDDLVRGHLAFDLKLIGDPVLVRSTGLPAYNYAVVVDDALMSITHVIRGEDHISNTPRQLLIYRALGLIPPQFAHLAMVMGKDNTRLSKRHGATAVDQFQKEGVLASALFNYLALLGWAPPEGREVLAKDELLGLFDLKKVSRAAAIFDYEKLNWINRQHIKRLGSKEKAKIAYPYLKDYGIVPDREQMTAAHWTWLESAVEILAEGMDKFGELPPKFALFFDFSPAEMDEETKVLLQEEQAKDVVRLFGEKIALVREFDYAHFSAITVEIRKETGAKGKNLYHPLRVALTAKASGLELDKFIPLVEAGARLEFPKRIKNCAERVAEILAYLKFS